MTRSKRRLASRLNRKISTELGTSAPGLTLEEEKIQQADVVPSAVSAQLFRTDLVSLHLPVLPCL